MKQEEKAKRKKITRSKHLFLPHHVLDSWRDSHSVVQNRLVIVISIVLYLILLIIL